MPSELVQQLLTRNCFFVKPSICGSGSNEVDFGLRISYKSDLKLLIKKLICLTRFSRFTGKKLLEAMLLEY